jgi:hypothetical protein
MPVLRQHDVWEFGCQRIDQGHNLVSAGHGEAAAGTEVVLDVDNEKRVALADSQIFFQTEVLSFSANISGEFDPGIRDVNRIGAIGFKFVQ